MFTSKGNMKAGKLPEIASVKYLPILDSSMADLSLGKGDLIIFKENDYDYSKNKVVAVVLEEGETANSIENFYITASTSIKGDKITTMLPDGTQAKEFVTDAVIGRAVSAIPRLGYAVAFSLSENGLIYLFAIPLALIVIGLVLNYVLKINDKYDEYELVDVEDDVPENDEVIEVAEPTEKQGREIVLTKRSYNTAQVTHPDLDFANDLFGGEVPKEVTSAEAMKHTTIPFQITNDMLITKEKFKDSVTGKLAKAKNVLDNAHPLFDSIDSIDLKQPDKQPTLEMPTIHPDIIKAALESTKKHNNFKVDLGGDVQPNLKQPSPQKDTVSYTSSGNNEISSINLASLDDTDIEDLFDEIFNVVDDEFSSMQSSIDNIINGDSSSDATNKADVTANKSDDTGLDDLFSEK